jgi:para-nitrobenzyl esterase
VSEEGMSFSSKPGESEFLATLNQQYPGKGEAILAAMKRANPRKSIRTLSYAVRGYTSRNSVQRQARLKHGQGGAPAYQYWFTWQSPQLDGVAGAWHTAELAFCFDNTKRCEQGTGDTPQAQALAKKMAGAWAAFAHTGNPGMGWTPSDPVRNQTMIFDDVCRMEDDPHAEVRKLIAGAGS